MCFLHSFFSTRFFLILWCFREQEPLKAGDLVKIELGCHVDYYSAVVGHTIKVYVVNCSF